MYLFKSYKGSPKILKFGHVTLAMPTCLPAEVFKHGGYLLKHRLHRFITSTWSSGCVPQQWKDANIVTIYKHKGDKAICGNSRGISFTVSVWQSLGWCDAVSASYTRSRHCNAGVTVRFPAWTQYYRHDVCRPSTTGKMP